MNYIKQLQSDLEAHKLAEQLFRKTLIEFRCHLNSNKFHNDTTIQVSDVHNWLTYIENCVSDALEK